MTPMTAPDRDAADREPADREPVDRDAVDARTVRRALRGGVRALALVAVLGVGGTALTGGTGAAALVWGTSAVVVGALVTAGWLVLAMGLDLVAGVVPGRRRVLWTLGSFAFAFVSPVLPAAAIQAAG